ncbi:bifunctional 4-hydroxy-2-oxoglutarate aldolase/2-dehydro-3-deoxy-phosphogluconate aldolase [Pedosphaera parvula]|uniref:2-dehydro-3-deoxyphosphogluconate aldolase/4-hydroxy-2-oxoglutarate aldolase n=1 Tax=Pedosphaera parvula (strain Ellin514) TaxID=320771 RepID=B9XB67_PEDPL|nr:bifunctional 4-hydroxy-2-oxoglutarate aldolase/2-dehydro-3-deoxy-phosphogluconate aldolase [Pedosphaera parvula]EEF62752.1 2-dehydro-3-deoxyphosphogluconate aldolase/4-hydroxy-2-oxoglutarate aldolase [Pedosphaera parvula Ellin514]
MRSKTEIVSLLLNPGIIAVVRATSDDQIIPLTEALIAGGVIAVEVTMTTPNAIQAIREASQAFGSRALIGVGTVLDAQTCRQAIKAGAEFVVSPIMRPEIAREARAADRPVMLGAYTPTEAQLAYEAGSDYIKIFPADGLGPNYIKALRAPLPHLKIVPTGGVDVNNVTDFLKAGCMALGVGSSLVSAQILQDSDWSELTRRATEFVKAVQAFRKD